jgi:uncharacterized protein YoxC
MPQSQTNENNSRASLERVALKATRYIGSLPSLIIHSAFFVGIFALQFFGFSFDQIMLILTTVVSLEAIYLSIFIQMTVNHQVERIAEVSEDIDDIQEDVEDISEDVEEMSKDIDDIQEDVKEISEDIDDIQEDVEEISEDIDDIQEDVEDISEDVDDISKDDEAADQQHHHNIEKIHHIQGTLEELLKEIKTIKEIQNISGKK